MKNKGLRTFLSVGAALAVIFFGSAGSAPDEGRRVSNAVLLVAAAVGVAVWFLTKPGANKPVS